MFFYKKIIIILKKLYLLGMMLIESRRVVMNQNINGITNVPSNATNNNYIYLLYASIVLAAIACFLPYLTVSAFGYSESTNYIYYDGSIKDGVYVIVGLIAAFFSVNKKKYKGAIAGIAVGIGIWIFDFIDIQSNMNELSSGGLVDVSYGIGFYLTIVGLVCALITSIMLSKQMPSTTSVPVNISVSGIPMPQPMSNSTMINNQYNQQSISPQPVIGHCQYCGSLRNEGLYCKSCGGRY